MSISHEERLAFTEEDLAYLPDSFPRCVIRDGKIVRADGVPLEWEDYELLEEDFPAVLTNRGELRMTAAPTDTHEKSNNSLVRLLGHYLSCHAGGNVITNRALRIAGYPPAVPDVVFFRHPSRSHAGRITRTSGNHVSVQQRRGVGRQAHFVPGKMPRGLVIPARRQHRDLASTRTEQELQTGRAFF